MSVAVSIRGGAPRYEGRAARRSRAARACRSEGRYAVSHDRITDPFDGLHHVGAVLQMTSAPASTKQYRQRALGARRVPSSLHPEVERDDEQCLMPLARAYVLDEARLVARRDPRRRRPTARTGGGCRVAAVTMRFNEVPCTTRATIRG